MQSIEYPKYDDRYAIMAPTVEHARQMIDAHAKLEWRKHSSDYYGEYLSARLVPYTHFRLKHNEYSDGDEIFLLEPGHPECAVVLELSSASEAQAKFINYLLRAAFRNMAWHVLRSVHLDNANPTFPEYYMLEDSARQATYREEYYLSGKEKDIDLIAAQVEAIAESTLNKVSNGYWVELENPRRDLSVIVNRMNKKVMSSQLQQVEFDYIVTYQIMLKHIHDRANSISSSLTRLFAKDIAATRFYCSRWYSVDEVLS